MFIKRKGERAGTTKAKIAYSHPSHKEFNERLEARQAPRVASTPVDGPWLSAKALAQLPALGRAFDLNRDPYVRAQRLDERKTEAQRREDASGRGSGAIEQEAAKPAFRPPEHIRKPVDRAHFDERWLAKQRAAVMERVPETRSRSEEAPSPSRVLKEPSR